MTPAAASRHLEELLYRPAHPHISPASARCGETRRQRCISIMQIKCTPAGLGSRHRRGSGGCSWQASRAFCNARQEGCSKAQARRATTGRQNRRVQHALAARNPCRDRERGMWRASLPWESALGALSRIVQVGAQESQKNVRTGSADPFTRKHYSWRYRDYAGRVERVRWRHMRVDGRWALATGRS